MKVPVAAFAAFCADEHSIAAAYLLRCSGRYIFSNLDAGSKKDARFVAVRAMGLWRSDDSVSSCGWNRGTV